MNWPAIGTISAVLICLITMGGLIWRMGQRDGKIDQLLEQLVKGFNDHEQRIRMLAEHDGDVRARHARSSR